MPTGSARAAFALPCHGRILAGRAGIGRRLQLEHGFDAARQTSTMAICG
jgi:hypothetical protein